MFYSNLSYRLSFPWLQNSFARWLVAYVFSVTLPVESLMINATFLTFYISICLHYRAFRKKFETIVAELKKESRSGSTAGRSHVKQRLQKLIEFHIFMKEYRECFL